jgi:hypothetical protein
VNISSTLLQRSSLQHCHRTQIGLNLAHLLLVFELQSDELQGKQTRAFYSTSADIIGCACLRAFCLGLAPLFVLSQKMEVQQACMVCGLVPCPNQL